MHALKLANAMLFLSTLSLRRATAVTTLEGGSLRDFYPRSPCGERPPVRDIIQWEGIFLSTLSLRRATVTVLGIQHRTGISIHALLAESDKANKCTTIPYFDFYPRSPCGERPQTVTKWASFAKFLSTLSLRRATLLSIRNTHNSVISIHALLAESD